MIRAVITDLDRTLLRSDKSVSEDTLRVLRAVKDQGILLMAATARPARAIAEYRALIPFDAVATLNGAVILLPDKTVSLDIPGSAVRDFLSRLDTAVAAFHPSDPAPVFISLETSEGILSNQAYAEWNPTVVPDLLSVPLPDHIYKILLSSETLPLPELLPPLLPPETYYTVADGTLYQVMSHRATKWNGIRRMLESRGILPEDAVFFGDDNDDLESLRLCGTGVAVSNAIPGVLEAADAVTGSNDEDGVAKYLEANLLAGGPAPVFTGGSPRRKEGEKHDSVY